MALRWNSPTAGEIDAAMAEFDKLLDLDTDYTAGYFMAAQTLAKHGRTAGSHRAPEVGHQLRGAHRQPPCSQRDAGDARRA